MDWHALDQVVLHPSTERLLDDVRRGLDEVNRLRPLHPNLVESVTADLLADRVYNSNAVEGNPLDLRETRRILEAGHQLTEEKRSRSELEVINLGTAVGYFEREIVPAERPHQTANLLALHAILMKDVDDEAGRFRHRDVMVRGAKHQPPDPSRVEKLIQRAFGELESAGSSVDPVVAAAWVHWAIARIHPFFDGNGRTARLWQDLVLLQSRATCAIIRPEERTRYYAALQEADEGWFDALVLLVAERTAWTIDRIRLAAAQDSLRDWAARLTQQENVPSNEEISAEYVRWSRQLRAFSDALVACGDALNTASADLVVIVSTRELIDVSGWRALRWDWLPTDGCFAELDVAFKGTGCGIFVLSYGDSADDDRSDWDAELKDSIGLEIRPVNAPKEHGRYPLRANRVWAGESALNVLVSSNGLHLLSRTFDAQGGRIGMSVRRQVEPQVAAQEVVRFVIEAARAKWDS